jgi:CBS domain-containing protein
MVLSVGPENIFMTYNLSSIKGGHASSLARRCVVIIYFAASLGYVGEGSMTTTDIMVQQVMVRRVYTVSPSATLLKATEILRRYHISGLPVVDEDRKVIGVISEKDVARALSEAGDLTLSPSNLLDVIVHTVSGRKAKGRLDDNMDDPLRAFEECFNNVRVRDVMSQDPIVVSEGTSVDDAARIMMERNINRLPVVKGDRLVGILTRHDVLAAWVE